MNTSNIGAEHPSYGPLPLFMTWLENLRYNPVVVSKYLPMITSYLLFVESSTWHFHITILVAIKFRKHNSTFTFFEVVKFPDWVSHVVITVSFYSSFDISLTITSVEVLPLSNMIQKFLNFALPIRVSIHPFSIG